MEFCTVEDNGAQDVPGGPFDDKDGIRVDERLDGDLCSTIVFSEFVGNLYDGCELDESGNGHVFADAWFCTFDENGFGSLPDGEGETDPEDGYDIDEAGAGRVDVFVFDLRRCDVENNGDDGVVFEESDAGDLDADVRNTDIEDNDDNGLAAEQEAPGTGTLRLKVTLTGNGDDVPDTDGVTVE